MVIKDKLQKK